MSKDITLQSCCFCCQLPLMRFVDDNDYGGDGDDDVSPRNNLGEIPRVVVLMKRMKQLEPGDRETQRSMGLKKEQRDQQTG